MKILFTFYISIIALLFPCITLGQQKCHIKHYSLADGLPQRTIMNIIQDKKGFMWFATWDGLCKFDGSKFTTFKTSDKDSVFMSNNRIDNIYEDIFGYIWVQTYNKESFRFDPQSEKYIAAFQDSIRKFSTYDVLCMPSGKVWLASEKNGAICVLDSLNKKLYFNTNKKNLKSNFVNSIYEDTNKNSWILTNNGLTQLSSNNKEIKLYFNNRENEFLCAIETTDELWFGCNNGKIWCYNKDYKRFELFDIGVQSDIIHISKVYDNMLIILTSKDGFFVCDKNKSNLKKFDTSNLPELPNNEMRSCFIDRNNNIWLETSQTGVAKFNIIQNRLKFYYPENSKKEVSIFAPKFYILEDKSGTIWVHPRGGGFSYYNKITDKLQPFFNLQGSPEWRFSDELHDVFVDRQGILWMSTRSDGLEKVVFDSEVFKLNDFNADLLQDSKKEIRAMFEDKNKNIWLASKDGKIQIYNASKNFIGYLCSNGSFSANGSPLYCDAYSFFEDKDQNIWIGTKGSGVYLLETQNNSYKITQYKHNPTDLYSLSGNSIYSIHQDDQGKIWLGVYEQEKNDGGINLFDSINKRFINHRNLLKGYPNETGNQVRCINSYKNKLYVGTSLGLIVFNTNYTDSKKIDYKVYSKSRNTENGLQANGIFDIFVTKNKEVYIATFGGGLSKITQFDSSGFPSVFKTYSTKNGIHSDIIFSIKEDNNNNLWINGEGSVSKFSPKDEIFEQFNNINRIINNQYFSEAKPLLTYKNELIYGCSQGTLSFFPDKLTKNEYKPYLALINLKVHQNGEQLKYLIDDLDGIELLHDENIFSIEFAALDYTNPNTISYAYKLEGFDNNWIYSQNQYIVNYSKLPPGDYVFKVKSTNSNGTWTDNERHFSIRINPSFWQTGWAYFAYIVFLISTLYIILHSIFIFYRMKDRVQLEQEQTEMKTRFFIDISHEIRTPLTMIVSPLENILDSTDTSDKIKPQLQLVLKNANRMLNMVNQILDFRKIQKLKLQVRETIFTKYIDELCKSIQETVENQGVNLFFDTQLTNERLWIDTENMEKLFINLISNAMKYSEKGKSIVISVFAKDKHICLAIKDEGKGMGKDIMDKLFTRFSSFNTDKSKPSTGIGLSIVKEVVDKHHAKISVDSNTNEGSCFTIFFRTGCEHFLNDDSVEILSSPMVGSMDIEPKNQIIEDQSGVKESNTSKLSILVVEDDNDLRNFIKSVLDSYYIVHEAENGESGYRQTLSLMPDFILSDIMMPEVDGIEFLQKIRSNSDTCHIPFILLTAKSSIDNKLEGIMSGADDYITKPFNVKILIAKIDNILQQRKLYSRHLSLNQATQLDKKELANKLKESVNKITEQDELFLKKLQQNILDNIDNSDFTIDQLAAKTNFSRRVFFNKLKSLTGMAPIEFVREIRVKHSAELLKDKDMRIKEVAYMVGFSDIRYFSQCFKDVYGMTPSDYRKQL